MDEDKEIDAIAAPPADAAVAMPRRPIASPDFDKWIEHFYKECGREITLAYTTLNQMKNWAMLIVAAVVSAVVAVQKASGTEQRDDLPVYIGALIAYIFTLRFFIRAILCYINLSRWNNLQKVIAVLTIAQPSNVPPKTQEQLKSEVLDKIEELYFGWHSPPGLNRRTQLLANLKLGFGLLLALPLFFAIVVGLRMIPFSPFALGITTFAAGYTLVEFIDFFRTTFFDTSEVYARRKPGRRSSGFPTPILGSRYLVLSVCNVVLSVTVAFWPEVASFLARVFDCR